jgi:hypothetical protein
MGVRVPAILKQVVSEDHLELFVSCFLVPFCLSTPRRFFVYDIGLCPGAFDVVRKTLDELADVLVYTKVAVVDFKNLFQKRRKRHETENLLLQLSLEK